MTDVFISYSRKDQEIVRRLHDALVQVGRDTWVDWENIPLTAEWWHEICNGIESSDTFLFVISPDSVRSRVCADEIEWATKNNKRIVPILYRELIREEDQQVAPHPVINAHNWVFFRDTDDFETAFRALLTALDTDLAYVRTHTRQLIRAREWENKGRNASLLLRGSDLAEAETWLTQSSNKEPYPLPLQLEYIAASRVAQNRRQRTILTSVSVALLLTLGLTALSFVLFRQSEAQRTVAEQRGTGVAQQAATATYALGNAEERLHQAWNTQALFLADLSHQRVNVGDVRQGILLALEGLAHRDDGINNPENAQALLDSLAVPGEQVLALEHPGTWANGLWNHDGTRILARDETGVVLWDAQTGQALLNLPHDALVTAASWNSDETQILSVTDQAVRVWDASTGELRLSLPHATPVLGAQWSPDNTQILTVIDGELQLWDAVTGDKLKRAPDDLVGSASWSPTGTRIVTWEGKSDGINNASIWDAASLKKLFVLPHDSVISGWLGNEVWNKNETQLLTWTEDGKVRIWDAATGEQLHVFEHSGLLNNAAWSPDETRILVVTDEGIVVWDALKEDLLFELDGNGAIWSADGTQILNWGSDVVISDAATGESIVAMAKESYPDDVIWSPDQTQLLVVDYEQAQIWDVSTTTLVATLLHKNFLNTALWSPDGTRVLTNTMVYDGNMLYVWDIKRTPDLVNLPGDSPLWNHTETQILLRAASSLKVWDLAQQKIVFAPSVPDGWFIETQWSADDQHILTGINSHSDCQTDCPFFVQIWTIGLNEPTLTISEEGSLSSLSWNADETKIMMTYTPPDVLTCEHDCTAVRIWDAVTGEELLTLPFAGNSYVDYATWNRAETRLLTMTYHGSAQIWDANTAELLFSFQPAMGAAGVRWNKDETRLLVWSNGPYSIEECAADCPYTLEIVDIATNTSLFSAEHQRAIKGAIWNADETKLLSWSEDGTARVWDGKTGQLLLTLSHTYNVVDAAWNADETRIVTASQDNTVCIWDALTGEKLLTLTHADDVLGAAWSADGMQILTWSADSTAKIWRVDLDQLIDLAQSLDLPPLTEEERTQYYLPALSD